MFTGITPTIIGIRIGFIAASLGLIAFTLNWNFWEFWGGPMPGYQFLLYPGNLTIIHIWHPLFTEEVGFWQKLALLILGQFISVAIIAGCLTAVIQKLSSEDDNAQP